MSTVLEAMGRMSTSPSPISPRPSSTGVTAPGRSRRRMHAGGTQLALAGLLLSACTIGDVDQKVTAGSAASPGAESSVEQDDAEQNDAGQDTDTPQPHQGTTTVTEETSGQGSVPEGINIAAIQEQYDVQLAVAVAHTRGDWGSEWNGSNAAWSTVKVPLAIAASRSNPTDPDTQSWIEAAITYSDNDAALRLWNSLGGGESASAAVEKVLAEGGVTKVEVPSQVTRPGFSAFGQTKLTPAQEATFAKNLPTIAGADPVLAAMGRIVPSQSYGIGTIAGARFKGGWGPGETNGFDSRQLGVVSASCGEVGVALSAWSAAGDQNASQQALSELAGRLTDKMLCSAGS